MKCGLHFTFGAGEALQTIIDTASLNVYGRASVGELFTAAPSPRTADSPRAASPDPLPSTGLGCAGAAGRRSPVIPPVRRSSSSTISRCCRFPMPSRNWSRAGWRCCNGPGGQARRLPRLRCRPWGKHWRRSPRCMAGCAPMARGALLSNGRDAAASTPGGAIMSTCPLAKAAKPGRSPPSTCRARRWRR